MAATKRQAPNPWVPRRELDATTQRCIEAENCLKQLIHLIDPDVLADLKGDWKLATEKIVTNA